MLLSSVVLEVAVFEFQCVIGCVVHGVQHCSVKSIIILEESLCKSELAVIDGEDDASLGSLVGYECRFFVIQNRFSLKQVDSTLEALIAPESNLPCPDIGLRCAIDSRSERCNVVDEMFAITVRANELHVRCLNVYRTCSPPCIVLE